MSKERGCWVVRKRLQPGKHTFKFVVNGVNWWIDLAKPHEKDGNEDNNYIVIDDSTRLVSPK